MFDISTDDGFFTFYRPGIIPSPSEDPAGTDFIFFPSPLCYALINNFWRMSEEAQILISAAWRDVVEIHAVKDGAWVQYTD